MEFMVVLRQRAFQGMKAAIPVFFILIISQSYKAHAGSALAANFICQSINGIPATVVQTKEGKQVPIIFWKSNTFSSSGWTPIKRCQEVTTRFQTYHSDGSLEFITTGRINNLPSLCVAKADGGPCVGLLYTLKPDQNASKTLMELFSIRSQPNAAPLEETTSRPYFSIDAIITSNSALLKNGNISPPSSASKLPSLLF